MTEALNLDGPANLELIHTDEARELAYWAHVLDVSEGDLKTMVARVGPSALDVRRHIARLRRVERQRKAHRSPHHAQTNEQVSGGKGDPLFALMACCAAAVATTFGALAYKLPPSDDSRASQRQRGCEAAVNAAATIEQLGCPAGNTIARTKLADAANSTEAKPMR